MMTSNDERMHILEMIANGQITASEGVKLLEALEEGLAGEADLEAAFEDSNSGGDNDSFVGQGEDQPVLPPEQAGDPRLSSQDSGQDIESNAEKGFAVSQMEFVEEASPGQDDYLHPIPGSPGIDKWRRWRWIPLGIGIGITVLGSLLMLWAYQATQFSFWFACSWLPFLIGVALIVLSSGLKGMRWLHVRIQQEPGQRPESINISLPLPLGTIAWFVGLFGRWIPGDKAAMIKTALLALKETPADQPVYLEVDEGESGERVEIFIG
jgi:hypothetical protein